MKTTTATLLMAFLCLFSVETTAQNSGDFESLMSKLQDKNSNEIIYSVQLGAFKKNHRKGYYKDVKELFSNTYDDGYTRFFSSLFQSISEAVTYRDKMRTEGFPDAFVLGLDGGFDRILIEVD